MDSAIENVLVDFESSMKAFYPTRWYEIEQEAGLKDLDQIQRSGSNLLPLWNVSKMMNPSSWPSLIKRW
jgi:hypothetical protein